MDFSHRFNTNYIPSDAEIDFIRVELVSHTQELERIDDRIRALSAQREQIQAYIDSHKALISHPRRLPVDILREIFITCLPANRNAVMSAREAPLLLGRICSAWRAIALSTPRLWASLHAPLDYILEKEPRKLAVIEWLQRSGSAPISLSVCPERGSRNSSESNLSAWSEGGTIVVQVARCRVCDSMVSSGKRWPTQGPSISGRLFFWLLPPICDSSAVCRQTWFALAAAAVLGE